MMSPLRSKAKSQAASANSARSSSSSVCCTACKVKCMSSSTQSLRHHPERLQPPLRCHEALRWAAAPETRCRARRPRRRRAQRRAQCEPHLLQHPLRCVDKTTALKQHQRSTATTDLACTALSLQRAARRVLVAMASAGWAVGWEQWARQRRRGRLRRWWRRGLASHDANERPSRPVGACSDANAQRARADMPSLASRRPRARRRRAQRRQAQWRHICK